MKAGSGNEASVSMGALLGELGGGTPLLRALKIMKENSGDGHLSSWRLSWATWSGLIYWGLSDVVERGSGGGVSLSVGAL